MELYMPAILTKLGACLKNHATPEAAKKAKNISVVAAIQIGVAALLYCFFMKMRQIDEKNPPEDISRETLSICTSAVISPGATAITQQAKLMMKGFDSFKNGLQKQNLRQMANGLALTVVTYIATTNFFNNYPGMIERFLERS